MIKAICLIAFGSVLSFIAFSAASCALNGMVKCLTILGG